MRGVFSQHLPTQHCNKHLCHPEGGLQSHHLAKVSIAADTPCVPGVRKVSNQCLRKRWWLKQGGSGSGAINVPNFAKHLQTRRNHPTCQKHHEDHQSARSCTRRPSGTSERRPTVSRPVPRVHTAHHHWHLFVASQL